MMKRVVLLVGPLTLFLSMIACNRRSSDATANTSSPGVAPKASAAEIHHETRSSESSPYIVGVWKFIAAADGGTPSVDTEFRFINPTDDTLTLEYAFFDQTGAFCGCDRDTFDPNKTTIYTVLGEQRAQAPAADAGVNQFFCSGTSGALKAIVFKHRDQDIFLADATQVGFQLHAFGSLVETPDDAGNFNFLTGAVMTESGMKGIALNESTRDEIQKIHDQCVTLQGPLTP